MLDAQARLLFGRYIEMTGPSVYNLGLNFGKYFRLSLKPREKNSNNIWFIYPKYSNIVYDTIAVLAPPREISDVYDELRAKELEALANRSADKPTEG